MREHDLAVRLLVLYGTKMHHRGQERVHSWLRRTLRIDSRGSFAVERGGFKWVLSPADYVQARLFWFGDYDPWDVHHLLQFLRPGAILFDIGANFGYYSIAATRRLGPRGQVHAFEPFPPNAERLRTHIALNRLDHIVQVSQVALSDQAGRWAMVGREDNSGAAYLASAQVGQTPSLVEATTIDAYCASSGVVPDVVKLDVEGAEERVLKGAELTLSRFTPIVLTELNPPTLTRAGSSVESVARLLEELGYRLFVANRDKLVPLTRLPRGDEMVNAFGLPRK